MANPKINYLFNTGVYLIALITTLIISLMPRFEIGGSVPFFLILILLLYVVIYLAGFFNTKLNNKYYYFSYILNYLNIGLMLLSFMDIRSKQSMAGFATVLVFFPIWVIFSITSIILFWMGHSKNKNN